MQQVEDEISQGSRSHVQGVRWMPGVYTRSCWDLNPDSGPVGTAGRAGARSARLRLPPAPGRLREPPGPPATRGPRRPPEASARRPPAPGLPRPYLPDPVQGIHEALSLHAHRSALPLHQLRHGQAHRHRRRSASPVRPPTPLRDP